MRGTEQVPVSMKGHRGTTTETGKFGDVDEFRARNSSTSPNFPLLSRRGDGRFRFQKSCCVFFCLCVFVSMCLLQTSTIAHSAALQATANPVPEFVTTYCVSCHNDRLKTGTLTLEHVDAQKVSNSAETWERVVVKLRSRSMPPAGSRRPDNPTYDAVAAWLESELDRAAVTHLNPGRPANLHRLNRTEYANAVRDLTGIEIDAASMLPPDQQAHGFD